MTHAHKALIQKWLDDPENFTGFEWYSASQDRWLPSALHDVFYDVGGNRPTRLKPKPKPDVVTSVVFGLYDNDYPCYHVSSSAPANLRLTFDGETRKLKKAEVIE